MFETYIYAPFFNVLVGLYSLLSGLSPELADMGIAVIIFSLVIRVLTFPLTLAGERSEDEKTKIVNHVAELKRIYAHEPIRLRAEIKQTMRGNARTVIATTVNMIIQVSIILMLYRIFTTGLQGADYYLLYDFMPRPEHINLMFLNKYDLSHTNSTLNLVQSLMIFLVEVLSALRSPLPVSRKNKALLQLVLPLGSYLIFIFLPAGKKLFIIASLAFSAIYLTFRIIQDWGKKLFDRFTPRPSVAEGEGGPIPPPASNQPPLAS